jgi:hypothetical protein
MNPTRCLPLAAALLALGCGRSDAGSNPSAAAVAPAPAAAVAPAPAEVAPAAPPAPAEAGAPGEAIVAIGSDGKAQIIATGGKTIADTDSYTVALAAPDKVAKGADGVVTIDITPKKGWHLNHEFPTKLSVVAPAGATVAKAEQAKADATTWTDEKGQFRVTFKATAAGAAAFTGKLKFAVCTDATCDPKREELAWTVAVE